MEIAILGSTSQIAQSIAPYFKEHELKLFCRTFNNFKHFNKGHYDIVINCIGAGSPKDIVDMGFDLYELNEHYDTMVIKHLLKHPETLYVYLSSGAVHGTNKGFYTYTKKTTEYKHRELKELNIADLRVYAYVSRDIKLDSKYFIAEIYRCIRENEVFKTNSETLVRDYVAPYDLAKIILTLPKKNNYYEAFSKASVGKWDIIDYFVDNYGLKIEVTEEIAVATNANYHPIDTKSLEKTGYKPRFSSMDIIKGVAEDIL